MYSRQKVNKFIIKSDIWPRRSQRTTKDIVKEEKRDQLQKRCDGRDTGDLLLSGDLMRVVEEDRRLLMQASGGCFRFVVDVDRLSTIEGRRKNRQWKGLHRRWTEGKGIQAQIHNKHFLTLKYKIFTVTI